MIRICLNSTVDYTYEMLTRANQSNLQVKKVLRQNWNFPSLKEIMTYKPTDRPTNQQTDRKGIGKLHLQ